EKEGYEIPDNEGPKVDITSPKDGTKTTDSSIAVKGTVADTDPLKKIIVNGKSYESVNSEGKGFEPVNGTFNVNFKLVEGKNTIEIVAYDIYWNAGEKAKITVTRETDDSEPQPDTYFYVVTASSPAAG